MNTNIIEKDSFLNLPFFNKVRKEIAGYFHFLKETRDPSKILSKISQKLTYVKTFKTKGVQGITGILHCRSLKDLPIVFKISVEIDRTIEHENNVIESLNSLRHFCPHFVGSLGMYNLPISRTYVYEFTDDDDLYEEFDDSDNESSSSDSSDESDSDTSSSEESEEDFEECDIELFMDDKEFLPTNMMLLEYVSNITFEDLCKKYPVENRSLILSQMMMIMSALSISQKYLNFTHYDLHIENILIRQCEPEAIFIYNIDNKAYTVPTYGFYPVIIDMGSSYSKSLENNSMKTTVSHYNNGLQPTIYDPLNDLHHFLISALYGIERESTEFYFLSTRMLYFFRHIPILRKKGWKQLPNNIMKLSIKKINTVCEDLILDYKSRDLDCKKKTSTVKKTIIARSDLGSTGSQITELTKDIKSLNINKNSDTSKSSNNPDFPSVEGKRSFRISGVGSGKKEKTNGLYCFPVWYDLNRELVDILSFGVRLPWSYEIDKELENIVLQKVKSGVSTDEIIDEAIKLSFPLFLREFQRFDDIDKFEDTNDLLYMLRELVELVYSNWNSISKTIPKHISKSLLNSYKNTVIKEFKDMPSNLNWDSLLVNCKYVISILNCLFYKYVAPHIELINESYQKGEIKSSNDMVSWYKQNVALKNEYSNSTVLYIWDANCKTSNRVMLRDYFDDNDIIKLGELTPLRSDKELINKLKEKKLI